MCDHNLSTICAKLQSCSLTERIQLYYDSCDSLKRLYSQILQDPHGHDRSRAMKMFSKCLGLFVCDFDKLFDDILPKELLIDLCASFLDPLLQFYLILESPAPSPLYSILKGCVYHNLDLGAIKLWECVEPMVNNVFDRQVFSLNSDIANSVIVLCSYASCIPSLRPSVRAVLPRLPFRWFLFHSPNKINWFALFRNICLSDVDNSASPDGVSFIAPFVGYEFLNYTFYPYNPLEVSLIFDILSLTSLSKSKRDIISQFNKFTIIPTIVSKGSFECVYLLKYIVSLTGRNDIRAQLFIKFAKIVKDLETKLIPPVPTSSICAVKDTDTVIGKDVEICRGEMEDLCDRKFIFGESFADFDMVYHAKGYIQVFKAALNSYLSDFSLSSLEELYHFIIRDSVYSQQIEILKLWIEPLRQHLESIRSLSKIPPSQLPSITQAFKIVWAFCCVSDEYGKIYRGSFSSKDIGLLPTKDIIQLIDTFTPLMCSILTKIFESYSRGELLPCAGQLEVLFMGYYSTMPYEIMKMPIQMVTTYLQCMPTSISPLLVFIRKYLTFWEFLRDDLAEKYSPPIVPRSKDTSSLSKLLFSSKCLFRSFRNYIRALKSIPLFKCFGMIEFVIDNFCPIFLEILHMIILAEYGPNSWILKRKACFIIRLIFDIFSDLAECLELIPGLCRDYQRTNTYSSSSSSSSHSSQGKEGNSVEYICDDGESKFSSCVSKMKLQLFDICKSSTKLFQEHSQTFQTYNYKAFPCLSASFCSFFTITVFSHFSRIDLKQCGNEKVLEEFGELCSILSTIVSKIIKERLSSNYPLSNFHVITRIFKIISFIVLIPDSFADFSLSFVLQKGEKLLTMYNHQLSPSEIFSPARRKHLKSFIRLYRSRRFHNTLHLVRLSVVKDIPAISLIPHFKVLSLKRSASFEFSVGFVSPFPMVQQKTPRMFYESCEDNNNDEADVLIADEESMIENIVALQCLNIYHFENGFFDVCQESADKLDVTGLSLVSKKPKVSKKTKFKERTRSKGSPDDKLDVTGLSLVSKKPKVSKKTKFKERTRSKGSPDGPLSSQSQLFLMKYSDSRTMLQAAYDFIENTSACVEILFNDKLPLWMRKRIRTVDQLWK
ncbi:hypothetical protein ADUPG1_009638 [Aduncisulcus paluster]|uniref:Uncharacterized protein n=1 Tax=Aduncisulcus paluster TaxID=2918883 RepID=A0ABQ5KWB8_9EUKA|nr:hypothetical protein ADUPG1_009638 [Aduncisulcus paluster]